MNGDLKSHPEHINQDPYGKGWIFRLHLSGPIPPGDLMSADEYRAFATASSG
jgi:glycine cleavage system H protein